ncbi:hypothetical protein EV127DRAFT_145847 [Xylaria flabelliformis]|nr:hypothetical protein EV127DRAFT_145847 [Xylaria flabelliformis]
MMASVTYIPRVTHIFFCVCLADPDENCRSPAFRPNSRVEAVRPALGAATKAPRKNHIPFLARAKGSASEFLPNSIVRAGKGCRRSREYLELDGHVSIEVVGFARANFMNLTPSLGLYCAVSKEFKGSKLVFPGNEKNYLAFNG